MSDETIPTLDELAERLAAARGYLHIEENERRLHDLDAVIAQPGFWDDAQAAQATSKRASDIRSTLDEYRAACATLEDARAALELIEEDDAFAVEFDELRAGLSSALDRMEVESWFTDPSDACDAIVSVNPGSGGLEAQDWTDMLYRMYVRYAEKKGWKVKLLDVVPGEVIGLDRAVVQIEGKNAFGMLRSEHGVHRLVRISPSSKTTSKSRSILRTYASTCTVRAAPAVSASIRPTRRSASRTCRPESS